MAYPTTLDSFTPKVDDTNDVMAADVNGLQTAVASLQTKVGVDSSAVTTSHDYKIAQLETNTHVPVTVADSTEIDLTLTGQEITASLKSGSIDETKLDTSVNASLDKADSALQNIVEDTTPQLGGQLDAGAHSIGFKQQSFIGDGTTTINWGLGNKAYFTFGNANETFTFTAPSNPCNLVLVLKQYLTGGKTATWPNTVMWPGGVAPTLSIGNNAIDIISFYYDGTNYYGVSSLNFSVPA